LRYKEKIMRKIEIILGIAAIIAIFLKQSGITTNNSVILVPIGLLAYLYLFFGFALFNDIRFRTIFKKQAYKNSNVGKTILGIALGASLFILLTGILFKQFAWKNADPQLTIGLLLTAAVTFFYFLYYLINKPINLKKIFIRIAIIVSFAIGFLFF